MDGPALCLFCDEIHGSTRSARRTRHDQSKDICKACALEIVSTSPALTSIRTDSDRIRARAQLLYSAAWTLSLFGDAVEVGSRVTDEMLDAFQAVRRALQAYEKAVNE